MHRRYPRPSGSSRAQRDAEADPTAPGNQADPEGAARQVVIRQLLHAPRTRAQLAATLTGRGYTEATVEQVLDRFSELRLIDDEEFAHAWVESRHAGRGLARRMLAYELRARGVAEDTVDAAVAKLSPDQEEETARALVRRRLHATVGQDTQARIRRVVGALARKGYPAALAFRLVREELAEDIAPGEPLAEVDDWDD
jgi:regulatory protein